MPLYQLYCMLTLAVRGEGGTMPIWPVQDLLPSA